MHNAAADFDGSPYPYLTGDGEWLRMLDRLCDQPRELIDRIEEIRVWREALPRPPGGFPVTHGDMNAGNAMWDGQRIRLIDFEEPIYTWNAADMARPFRETQGMSVSHRKTCFEAFMSGYKMHRAPQFHDPLDYSNFITMKNLEMYGWGLKEWKGDKSFDGRDMDVALAELKDVILRPLMIG